MAITQPADARVQTAPSFDPAEHPPPSGREEAWRFTPLRRLRGLLTGPSGTSSGGSVAGQQADGKVVVEVDPAPEVTAGPVERSDPRLGSVLRPVDRVAALAFAGFEAATAVTVPAGVVASRPSFVTVRGEGGLAHGHFLVDVEEGAEAVVVVDHVGSATFGANLEVRVGPGASLTLVSLQDWDGDAVHAGAQEALVGRDARFRSIVISLGGDLVRLTPTVRFGGPGADAQLLGLCFADAGQHLEHRLLVDHNEPHCRSRVTYKGALQGEQAHTVWIGDVVIRPTATGTDTYEVNRNLLLTDGARADSVPNLEIETGEVVGAGHASATGRFDDEQLFYLQSRGISAEAARRLVVRGFFADLVGQIGLPAIEARLMAAIEAELERV